MKPGGGDSVVAFTGAQFCVQAADLRESPRALHIALLRPALKSEHRILSKERERVQ